MNTFECVNKILEFILGGSLFSLLIILLTSSEAKARVTSFHKRFIQNLKGKEKIKDSDKNEKLLKVQEVNSIQKQEVPKLYDTAEIYK